jgi:hypothetical protein
MQIISEQPMPRKPATIVVMPLRHRPAPVAVPDGDDAHLEINSLHLYGCVSLCCSVEEREIMRRHLTAMREELDEVKHVS